MMVNINYVLIGIVIIGIILYCLYKNGIKKINKKTNEIVSVLNRNPEDLIKHIDTSMGICRQTPGIVFGEIYKVLDKIRQTLVITTI